MMRSGYTYFGKNIQSDHMWEVRFSVDHKEIDSRNENNSIEKIKQILQESCKDLPLNPKLFVINLDEDLINGYDGALAEGKDRTQIHKEVCIYLVDSPQNQMSTDEYKIFFLSLWRKFQENNIHLHFPSFVPGDKKILGPRNLPTPMSFSSKTKGREWEATNGILCKVFEPYDNDHPILKLVITKKDLDDAGIRFSAEEVIEDNNKFVTTHQSMACLLIENEIEKIKVEKTPFKKFLDNDELMESLREIFKFFRPKIIAAGKEKQDYCEHVKNKLTKKYLGDIEIDMHDFDNLTYFDESYNDLLTKLKTAASNLDNQLLNDEQRNLVNADNFAEILRQELEEFQKEYDNKKSILLNVLDQLSKKVKNNEAYQALIQKYPRDRDRDFGMYKWITSFSKESDWGWKTEEELNKDFTEAVHELRADYDAQVNDIVSDFNKHVKPTDSTIAVEWSRYHLENFAELIQRNPQRMQILYRRILILEQERAAQDRFTTEMTMYPDIKIIPAEEVKLTTGEAKTRGMEFYHRGLTGIDSYTKRDRDTPTSHLSWFSRHYDKKRGLYRANLYASTLRSPSLDVSQKLLIMYALLSSNDGNTLKGDVAEAILGNGNRDYIKACNELKQLLFTLYNDQAHKLNDIVGELVKFANCLSKNTDTFPQEVWEFKKGPHLWAEGMQPRM